MISYKSVQTQLKNLYEYQYNYVDNTNPEERTKQNHFRNQDLYKSRIEYLLNVIDDVNISATTRRKRIKELLLMLAINERADYLPNALCVQFHNLVNDYGKKLLTKL